MHYSPPSSQAAVERRSHLRIPVGRRHAAGRSPVAVAVVRNRPAVHMPLGPGCPDRGTDMCARHSAGLRRSTCFRLLPTRRARVGRQEVEGLVVDRTAAGHTAADRIAADRTAAGRTAAGHIVVAGRTAAAVARRGCRL